MEEFLDGQSQELIPAVKAIDDREGAIRSEIDAIRLRLDDHDRAAGSMAGGIEGLIRDSVIPKITAALDTVDMIVRRMEDLHSRQAILDRFPGLQPKEGDHASNVSSG